MYANWSAVCYTWESSKVYSWSTLARSLSSLSGPRVGTEDDGWAEVSRAVVNLSITSLLLNMIPWYWRHTSSEAFDMSCAYSHYVCTNKIVSLYHSKTIESLSFNFAMRPIMSEGNGITVLEFCFWTLFFKRWKMCPHISIFLWVKRSYKKIVLGADNVIRLVIGYKLLIITWARVLIS